jgi:hypothetical protein
VNASPQGPDDRKEAPNHWFALLIVLGIPIAMIVALLVWWFCEFSNPAAP